MEPSKILPVGLGLPDRKNQIRWLKILLLAFLSVASFALAWQFLATGFSHSRDLMFWISSLVAAAFGIAFLTLLTTVGSNKWLFAGTNAAIFVCYLALAPKDWYALAGGLLFFGISFLFERRIRSDEKTRADFSLHRIIRSSVNLMVYGLLLIVGLNIYAKFQNEFQANPKNFYNQIGRYAAEGLDYLPTGLGNFDPNQRFDEFVVSQAQRQEPMFNQASPSQKQELADQVKSALEQKFNLKISGNPVLGDVVAGWVSEKVASSAISYQKFFPAIFAIISVVLLRWIAFVFVWLTMLISWVIYRLLLLFKFFRIEKVQVEVNKLQI